MGSEASTLKVVLKASTWPSGAVLALEVLGALALECLAVNPMC